MSSPKVGDHTCRQLIVAIFPSRQLIWLYRHGLSFWSRSWPAISECCLCMALGPSKLPPIHTHTHTHTHTETRQCLSFEKIHHCPFHSSAKKICGVILACQCFNKYNLTMQEVTSHHHNDKNSSSIAAIYSATVQQCTKTQCLSLPIWAAIPPYFRHWS